jgi:phage gp29-like protein
MGRHTEAFRALIAGIPNHSKGLTPEIARAIIIQISQGALQVVAELEEALDDKDREIDRLTEELLAAGKTKQWFPTS